jgi:hypothetical protein
MLSWTKFSGSFNNGYILNVLLCLDPPYIKTMSMNKMYYFVKNVKMHISKNK